MTKPLITCQCDQTSDDCGMSCIRLATAEDFLCDPCRALCARLRELQGETFPHTDIRDFISWSMS